MEQFFPALYGNEKIKALIGRDILEKRQHHAYIFEGPAGSGKHLLARETAKALLCLQADTNTLPCNTCLHCRKIDAQSYTDIAYINSGDKATVSVETVRNALATLAYAPDEGDYKVYIFEDADKMTIQAQNALLLSLEEPPAYAVFILLTTDSAALLETIRSRAVIFSMELFSREAVLAYLQQNSNAPKPRLQEASETCGGIIGAAKSILDGKTDTAVLSSAAGDFISLLFTGTAADALIYCTQMKYSRTQFDTFFVFAMSAVRDKISAKVGGRDLLFYKKEEEEQQQQRTEAAGSTLKRLTGLYDSLYEAREEIVHANAAAYPALCTIVEKYFRQN